jgi:hypothetical protein
MAAGHTRSRSGAHAQRRLIGKQKSRSSKRQLVNNQVAPSRIASTMATTITIVTLLRLFWDSLSNMRLLVLSGGIVPFASPETNTDRCRPGQAKLLYLVSAYSQ